MIEHPVNQPIRAIQIDSIPGVEAAYTVGSHNVTRIEACEKSGPYSAIPYVRVWADDQCLAELCQHNIVGVFFDPAEPAPPRESVEPGTCAECRKPEPECDCLPF